MGKLRSNESARTLRAYGAPQHPDGKQPDLDDNQQ